MVDRRHRRDFCKRPKRLLVIFLAGFDDIVERD
jgi:hypothetical protein